MESKLVQNNSLGSVNILREIEQSQNQLLTWFHDLHQIPELELELPQTVEYVCRHLDEMQIDYKVLPRSTGIIATIGKSGPVIGIRADMDALNVREETNLPFAAQNERMHACGHDAHTAILMAVAKFMKLHEDELPGRIRLIFQTGEEVLRGAKHMIMSGALQDPVPCCMLAMHVGSFCGENFVSGHAIVSESITFNSSDSFRITITGKGGHAASPHLSIDPILTASRIVEGLQSLVSRETNPNIPAVLSITHIDAGKHTYNVIPDQALLLGGIRTTTPETRTYLIRRAEEITTQIATAMRAEAKFEIVDGCPAVINDTKTAHSVFRSVEKLFPGEVHWMKVPNSCSEDASYFFEKIPGCYLFLASMAWDNGKLYPHHNAKFRLDETILWRGAAILVQATLDLLDKSSQII